MLLIILTMALFYFNGPVIHDSVHTNQDPETKASKWYPAIIHFIIYTCTFPTCKIACCKKGLILHHKAMKYQRIKNSAS